jgi:hypothetical protein
MLEKPDSDRGYPWPIDRVMLLGGELHPLTESAVVRCCRSTPIDSNRTAETRLAIGNGIRPNSDDPISF